MASSSSSSSSMNLLPFLQQEGEGETQEFKDFLSSLPREKGFMETTQLYQYQEFWLTAPLLQGVLRCQTQFEAQPTDLFLVSTPKSGTTWLKAMAFATINRARSYEQHPLLAKNPHDLVRFLEFLYTYSQDPDFTVFDSPRLFATHLSIMSLPESAKDSKCKIVYLCRNPKDTLISFWSFTNKLIPKDLEPIPVEHVFEKFVNGVSVFGPFWDHVLGYWKESLVNPERVCFLKFEDLKREPKVQLKVLAEFLDCPFSLEEENGGVLEEILRLCSFENLSSLAVNKSGKLQSGVEHNGFFRRGEVGDSENHLTPEMIKRLDRITDIKLFGSGLEF